MDQLPDHSGSAEFRCVTQSDGGTGRVAPVGEVDLATVGEVAEHLRALQAAGMRRVVLDLRRVTFMDSTGVRLLLEHDAGARRDGYAFAVVPGPTPVQRVLELAGITDHLTFEPA
jgi:anti-sigma B factor antagonist